MGWFIKQDARFAHLLVFYQYHPQPPKGGFRQGSIIVVYLMPPPYPFVRKRGGVWYILPLTDTQVGHYRCTIYLRMGGYVGAALKSALQRFWCYFISVHQFNQCHLRAKCVPIRN